MVVKWLLNRLLWSWNPHHEGKHLHSIRVSLYYFTLSNPNLHNAYNRSHFSPYQSLQNKLNAEEGSEEFQRLLHGEDRCGYNHGH